MRLIIYTGKGGVGKTSTSAATAYKLSKMGYRTLLMSTDSYQRDGVNPDSVMWTMCASRARSLWGMVPTYDPDTGPLEALSITSGWKEWGPMG